MRVYSFGDSWAYGSELKPGDRTFGQILADKLRITHINHGTPGFSMGNVMLSLLEQTANLTKDDIVIVILPPDIRWYTMTKTKAWKSLQSNNQEWIDYFVEKPIEYFIHHHNIFLYTMQSALKDKQCKYVLCHNYGNLQILPQYENLIDRSVLLSEHSLTQLLSDDDWNDNYDIDKKSDGPPRFTGKYFLGNYNHPNQLGHKRIAELINDKLKIYGNK